MNTQLNNASTSSEKLLNDLMLPKNTEISFFTTQYALDAISRLLKSKDLAVHRVVPLPDAEVRLSMHDIRVSINVESEAKTHQTLSCMLQVVLSHEQKIILEQTWEISLCSQMSRRLAHQKVSHAFEVLGEGSPQLRFWFSDLFDYVVIDMLRVVFSWRESKVPEWVEAAEIADEVACEFDWDLGG